ncbi:TonB-dependent copper receptor [Paraburkholderia caballeronis]|uniref:Iron complex outermembrane recepter protein n=1 Tax=Paraburkholderia caballeronis TaxID=416943 RepID=A0A1H7HCX3_9BURK|nr:TonB-dependent copper receptor [Paraburkholderia caballeronis]PXW29625.1 iron complex outermembrane receptor protein [Paraburkholderia caballeronis]PXX04884.1 iron complex outermembrane receptor protein [Paraburkholderia caballeronis]RAK05945.1 iron complex outermembrane receptor protein [Paraburkholderia caballeronis]SEB44476.1 iron complex outermembrane recepter protein [Paraburkholderia caballeronis]SEK46025.1 iron complex outermembrane recepter protein [Paraburkholderia caballeronis]
MPRFIESPRADGRHASSRAIAPPRRCRVACAVFSVSSLFAVPAAYADAAEDRAPDAPDVMLPPIEVVASPLAGPFANPLVSVTDPKTPRQPLPASDGADYLQTVPGFSSIRSGGTNGDPVLRGMFGSRLNIVANGAPVAGACPGRMDAPTSYVAPESFDKVTVVKGPQTVLYGPGASAGTVLFERDTARFDTPGVRAEGSVVGGQSGRNDQNVDLAAGTPDVYARVTANHAHAQDYRDGNGNAVPSGWDKWNADVALGVTPDADTKLELSAGTGDGNARYAGRGMDGVRFKRDSVALRFEKQHLGRTLRSLDAQLYYNEAAHRMDNYTLREPPAGSMPMASDVRRRTVGGRVAATLDLTDRVQWIAGADWQANRLDSRAAMGRQSPSDLPWTPSATLSNYGLFSELTWFATDAQQVIAGARLDRAAATDERETAGGRMGMGAMPNPTHDDERTRLLPGGFVRYEQTLRALPVTWYAGLGHTERFPDYWELFSPTSGPAGAVNAFTGVRPEKTTQLDVGARYRSASVDAWVSAYAGRVDDFILFTYGSAMGAATSQATNVNAQIMGGEFGATWKPDSRWRIGASAAYAWGRNADSGEPLPQMPPLDARFTLDYSRGAWSVGGLWRVVAPQRRYALHEGNVVGQDFGPSAGFGVVSLHAQYDVDRHTQLTIGVDNLFDKAYSEHLNLAGNAAFGYPANAPVMEPGRTVWARVRFKL